MALSGIIGQVLGGALIGALRENNVPEPTKVAKSAVKRLEADPVVINEMNGEPLYQSRTFLGSAAGFVSALGIVLTQIASHEFLQYDWAVLLPAIGAMWATGYAAYGRAWSGLKPLGG